MDVNARFRTSNVFIVKHFSRQFFNGISVSSIGGPVAPTTRDNSLVVIYVNIKYSPKNTVTYSTKDIGCNET